MSGPRLLSCSLTGNPISSIANPCCNQVLIGVVPALGKAMRRRDFIQGIGGSTIAGPLAALALQVSIPLTADAQQSTTPRIGFMSARSPEDSAQLLAQFHKGLGEGGIFEGRNVAIEYRWARGDYGQLPQFVDDFVKRSVNVLAAVGGDASAQAAKTAASSLPVVFVWAATRSMPAC